MNHKYNKTQLNSKKKLSVFWGLYRSLHSFLRPQEMSRAVVSEQKAIWPKPLPKCQRGCIVPRMSAMVVRTLNSSLLQPCYQWESFRLVTLWKPRAPSLLGSVICDGPKPASSAKHLPVADVEMKWCQVLCDGRTLQKHSRGGPRPQRGARLWCAGMKSQSKHWKIRGRLSENSWLVLANAQEGSHRQTFG